LFELLWLVTLNHWILKKRNEDSLLTGNMEGVMNNREEEELQLREQVGKLV